MLDLRPTCERCACDLPASSTDARICTFECTFCADCADGVLGGTCPNCTGELVARPTWHHGDAHRPGVVLRRYADAWQSGDLETILGCYAPDFTLHYSGSSRFAGTLAGRDAAIAVMVEVSTVAPRTLVSVDEILVGGDGGALAVTETLTRDGDAATITRLLRYRIAEGQLQECWLIESDQDTVDHYWR